MADLLGRAKRVGGGLLDFARALGSRQYSPAGNPELEAEAGGSAGMLRQQYDQNFRAARGQALRQGARWYEMNDMAGAAAQPVYDEALMRAVATADALKQRRVESGRTQGIHDYIQGARDLTDQQKAVLEAMDPEAAAKVLSEQAFPDPNQNRYSTQIIGDGTAIVTDNQTGEVRLERDPNHKPNQNRGPSLMRSEEGNDIVFRNPITGEETGRVTGGASRRFKPTEGQYKAAGYAARMQKSHASPEMNYIPSTAEYAAFTRIGADGATLSEAGMKAALNKAAMTSKGRKYFQRVSDWARAKLRHESGAVIAMEEIVSELNTYFPIPGDDPSVIRQKVTSRATANDAMRFASGDAWELWEQEHAEDAPKQGGRGSESAADRAARLGL